MTADLSERCDGVNGARRCTKQRSRRHRGQATSPRQETEENQVIERRSQKQMALTPRVNRTSSCSARREPAMSRERRASTCEIPLRICSVDGLSWLTRISFP